MRWCKYSLACIWKYVPVHGSYLSWIWGQFPITAIREIKILKKLHHQNIVNLKKVVTSPGLTNITRIRALFWQTPLVQRIKTCVNCFKDRERWGGEAKYDSKQKHHWKFCFIANLDVLYFVMLGSQGQQVQGEHLPLALACNDRLNSDRERLCFFLFCLFVDIA